MERGAVPDPPAVRRQEAIAPVGLVLQRQPVLLPGAIEEFDVAVREEVEEHAGCSVAGALFVLRQLFGVDGGQGAARAQQPGECRHQFDLIDVAQVGQGLVERVALVAAGHRAAVRRANAHGRHLAGRERQAQ